MIPVNRRLTVHEVSEETDVNKNPCHTILTKKLQMHHVSLKFVPRLLKDEQIENRVIVTQERFDGDITDENFLKNVITVDETRMHGYDVKTKEILVAMGGKIVSAVKEAPQSSSYVKVMIFFFFFL